MTDLIAEFLSHGGKVTVVEEGLRGLPKQKMEASVARQRKLSRPPARKIAVKLDDRDIRHVPQTYRPDRSSPLGFDLARQALKKSRQRTRT